MNKKYVVRLTTEERAELEALVRRGKGQAYKIRHAHVLLKVDADGPAWSDETVAEAFGCHLNTVRNLRQRLVEGGLEAALSRKKQKAPSRKRSLDGEGEARLIALACSPPPDGRSRWTLNLLSDRLVALNVVDEISGQTVRRTLKKTNFGRTGVRVG
jgi:transposase